MTVRSKVSGLFATLAYLAVWFTMAGAPPVAHAANLVVDRSCNSNQAAQITNAFHEAAALAHGALGAYFSRPTSNAAMNWFNVTDFDSVHRVINAFQSTDNRFMGSGTITVKCTCPSNSDAALTGANGFDACPNYFHLPPRGLESQAGVFFHEVTHMAAGTVDCTGLYPILAPIDQKWGPDMALDLAAEHPDKAIRNAMSYEYYAEQVYYGFDMSQITRFDWQWTFGC